jgi:hypothetical protein
MIVDKAAVGRARNSGKERGKICDHQSEMGRGRREKVKAVLFL